MRVAGSWSFQLWLTCTSACVYVCVFRLFAAHAPSSVVAMFSVHSTFCHLFAGLPVLLLCVLAAVHPNMALLPTGITSVRSASTRSRATVWPWGTTRHSHRRKLPGPGGWTLPGGHLRDYQAVVSLDFILWKAVSVTEASVNLFVSFTLSMQHDIKRAVWKEEKWHVGPWTVSTVWAVASMGYYLRDDSDSSLTNF